MLSLKALKLCHHSRGRTKVHSLLHTHVTQLEQICVTTHGQLYYDTVSALNTPCFPSTYPPALCQSTCQPYAMVINELVTLKAKHLSVVLKPKQGGKCKILSL